MHLMLDNVQEKCTRCTLETMHVEAERLVHFSPLLRCTGFQMENDFKALALGYFACAVPSSIDN